MSELNDKDLPAHRVRDIEIRKALETLGLPVNLGNAVVLEPIWLAARDYFTRDDRLSEAEKLIGEYESLLENIASARVGHLGDHTSYCDLMFRTDRIQRLLSGLRDYQSKYPKGE